MPHSMEISEFKGGNMEDTDKRLSLLERIMLRMYLRELEGDDTSEEDILKAVKAMSKKLDRLSVTPTKSERQVFPYPA
jgi:hypothetical protein